MSYDMTELTFENLADAFLQSKNTAFTVNYTINLLRTFSMCSLGFEPTTVELLMCCSTNGATGTRY